MATAQLASYGEFSLGVHSKGWSRRTPLEGTIELTHRCPLECRHCYNNLPMGDGEARQAELTLEEHRRIVDEIVEAGCLWLLYTGGEILARPDFLEIYRYARRQGLLLTLFTNGTLLTPRIADVLAEERPFSVEITLYGATRETYEALTGIPGSYDRCLRGIHLLLERKLPLKLKTVAISINKHEVWEMKRLARDLGVEFKFDSLMSPRIDCSQSPLAVRLKPEEVVAFDVDDAFRAAEWERHIQQARAQELAREHAENDEVYHCGGGVNSFAIDPYGKLSICTLSHAEAYDLRRGSFREGWDGFLKQVRSRKVSQLTKCVRCELKALCSMCPANGELENGSAESPVDFLCEVGHLRAYVFGREVPPHGDCEYCPGGAQYAAVRRKAEALRARPRGTESIFGGKVMLPVMNGAPAGGGCGSACAGACSG